MSTHLIINVLHGNSEVSEADRDRAESAALAVLAEAGVSVEAAFAEFQRQWAEFDDYKPMTGSAALWVRAEQAADRALTEGWRTVGGASCSISA